MKKITFILSFSFLLITLFSCSDDDKNDTVLVDDIAAIRSEYAPDKRVALFDVSAYRIKNNYTLYGESNLPDAVTALRERLTEEGIKYTDNIKLLPEEDLKDKHFGLVTISVANLRSNPKHSAELGTQATLGTPVKIIKKEGSWSLIQTPDQYLSWVDDGGIVAMNAADYQHWKDAQKMIYTKISGNTYTMPDETSQVVSDIVAGGILELLVTDEDEESDFFMVKYPDGREAYVAKTEASWYTEWLATAEPNQENLVATSKQLMGLPYLWGGTSTKGVDCSGFTKTIYFLNGMIIPRDASQQVHTGEAIATEKNFDKLLPGDLLFFGKPATDDKTEKVVHVGMWIGNNEFIHSSGQVHISSMDSNAANYDEANHDRFLRAKRIAKSSVGALVNLKETPIFND
ncbi:SH3 domain-containing C40 family peptidase [Cellulophaga sp. E16_2]|uniref:C40 family peptidase n=1 Tax=Cellulophaga sp. E16_2 TaxID=2789297 RepID=UPI002105C2C3|nr:SH3 domain-containing C40 family peptidase [Cellulophaga sp. E16_2]